MLESLHPVIAQAALPQNEETQRLRLDLLGERVTLIIVSRAYSSPELVDLHEDAMSVYRAIGKETPQVLPIIYARWAYELTTGLQRKALEHANTVLTVAQGLQAPISEVLGKRMIGFTLVMHRDVSQAVECLEQVLDGVDEALSDEIGFSYGQDTVAAANCYCAFGLHRLGKFEQAQQCVDAALQRAAILDDANTTGYVSAYISVLFVGYGDEVGLARCRELGFILWHTIYTGVLARAQLALGEDERAMELVSGALAGIATGRTAWMEVELHRIRGQILGHRDAPATEVESCYRTALEKAKTSPDCLSELRAALSLARHWQQVEDWRTEHGRHHVYKTLRRSNTLSERSRRARRRCLSGGTGGR
jgi:tetratricopeptide (TPR) repeat protein